MELQNTAVTVLAVDSLENDEWQPVSGRYATQLRISLLIYAVLLTGLPWLLYPLNEGPPFHIVVSANIAVAVVFIFLAAIWVPKRVRYTRYLLRELDMNVQKGCWWRTTISLAINRIQHMEVTQGPIERLLGLSRLVLYTAGGFQSDLKLPGLKIDTAKKLKTHLLTQIAREEVDEELL